MIKNKELMLGNWLLAGEKTQFPMQVVGIFSDVVYLDFEENQGDVWEEKEEDLFPIPLTEELLEKNGFVLDDNEYVKEYSYKDNRGNFIYADFLDGKCIGVKTSVLKQIEVIESFFMKYLHELQNTLTLAGIEFEFKV